MRKHFIPVILGTVAALALLGILEPVKSQITQIAPLAGQSLSVPTTAGGTQIVAPNPTRRALTICNVGATNPVWIAPLAPAGQTGVTVASQGAGSFLLSQMAAAGNGVTPSCFQLTMAIPQGGSSVQPLVTAGFTGIAVGGASNVTVWEY